MLHRDGLLHQPEARPIGPRAVRWARAGITREDRARYRADQAVHPTPQRPSVRWSPPPPRDGGPPPGPPLEDHDAPPSALFDQDDAPLLPGHIGFDPQLPDPADTSWQHPDPEEPPLDLDRLGDVPDLAELLLGLRQVDRLVRRNLARLRALSALDVAAVTGLSLTGWLTLAGRRTSADVRMLRTADRALTRLPSLSAAFSAGQISWAQVRSIALAVERLPCHLDDDIDHAVARGLCAATETEPDAVTRQIRWALAALHPDPDTDAEERATREQYLGMQPHPDGIGGRFWGEAGAEAFALLDAALNQDLPPGPRQRQGFAGDPAHHGPGRSTLTRRHGAARLERLCDILDDHLADHGRGARSAGPPSADHGDGPRSTTRAGTHPRTGPPSDPGAARRSRPTLLLRAELDSLLDRARTPASLLTTLLGGHVRVTADAARRLIDERGADLRTVILDDHGQVIGVGRKQRLAPGWLRETLLALHDTCSAPTCDTAARLCHLDHARPWYPTDPRHPPGRTDIDQLAPLCARDNTSKEAQGWTAMQQADGSRIWRHRPTGTTTRTLPATWTPRPRQPDPPP